MRASPIYCRICASAHRKKSQSQPSFKWAASVERCGIRWTCFAKSEAISRKDCILEIDVGARLPTVFREGVLYRREPGLQYLL